METRYLTLVNLVDMHDELARKYGGASGIRDAGLIEAALLRPQTGYYRDIIEEAASLWESLTMNHGFVDGNKRIGFAAAYIFLRLNGYMLIAESQDATRFVLDSLESGTFTKDNLDKWLRSNIAEKRP